MKLFNFKVLAIITLILLNNLCVYNCKTFNFLKSLNTKVTSKVKSHRLKQTATNNNTNVNVGTGSGAATVTNPASTGSTTTSTTSSNTSTVTSTTTPVTTTPTTPTTANPATSSTNSLSASSILLTNSHPIYTKYYPTTSKLDVSLFKVNSLIEDIRINDMSISFSGKKDLADPTKANIFNDLNLNIGTKVEVTARNRDGGPAIIGAAFIFKNLSNQIVMSYTSSEWKCNGKPAVIETIANKANLTSKTLPEEVNFIKAADNDSEIVCKGLLSQPRTEGNINVVVDDTITSVKLNGVQVVDTNTDDKNNWFSVRNYKPLLLTNDKIEICAKNNGNNLDENPASIMGTISFINNEGVKQTISTNSEWTCGNETAVEFGSNDDKETVWYKALGKSYDEIAADAQYIWSPRKIPDICCSVVLLKPRKEARMNLALDNYLNKLFVNGDELSFNRLDNEDWTQTKFFSILVRSGDLIELEIDRRNAKLPGLIATVFYLNSCGKEEEANTGDYWLCDGLKPNILDKKVEYCPQVSRKAKWIWSIRDDVNIIKCSVKLK